jgi:hypothetical protein
MICGSYFAVKTTFEISFPLIDKNGTLRATGIAPRATHFIRQLFIPGTRFLPASS